MTMTQSRPWRAVVATGVAAAMLTGCAMVGDDRDASPDEPISTVPGPAVGLAPDIPASLAFVDQSVAPATGTIATGAGAVGVHSAPDRLFTRLGVVRPGDRVGLTGNRAGVEDEQWAEMIWGTATAWIRVDALAP